MNTPDIAGLCERLRAVDYETMFDYPTSTGHLITEAADTIERQAAEIERLRGALSFYAEPENWHGTYSVGHAPMNDDWDDDLQHPLYPDGKLGKRARAALTGEDK
jgi:hypothetical protein